MTIETKFKPGETVWAMNEGEAEKFIVNEIFCYCDTYNTGNPKIKCSLINWCDRGFGSFSEDLLCKTKEELVERMFRNEEYAIIKKGY